MDLPAIISEAQLNTISLDYLKAGYDPTLLADVFPKNKEGQYYNLTNILKILGPINQKSPQSKSPIPPIKHTKTIPDAASARDASYDIAELQLSLIPAKRVITAKLVNPKILQLLSTIPAIGHYRSEQYNFRKRLVLIELPPNSLALPDHMKNALAKYKAPITNANIVITGTLLDPTKGSADKSYNLIFHPWLSNLYGGIEVNKHINMGIFPQHGIKAIPGGQNAPINILAARNINVHAAGKGLALSPNNVRFKVEGPISIFWSVAIEPSKKAGVITLHILLNTQAMEQYFVNAIGPTLYQKDALNKLLKNLENNMGTLTDKTQKNIIKKVVSTISETIRKTTT